MRKYMIVDATDNKIIQYPVNINKLAKRWHLTSEEVEAIVINASNSEVTVISWEDEAGNGVIIPTK